MTDILNPEGRILLLMSRVGPSSAAMMDVKHILEKDGHIIDFAVLMKLAATNGVSPLLYHNLRAHKHIREILPQKLMDQMENAFFRTIADNTKKAREMLRIIDRLNSSGIECIPLKGPIASDTILGNPGLYPSSDIDLLVKPKNLEKTREVLLKMGYEKSSDSIEKDMLRSSYHITFQNGRDILELHWKLAFRYFKIPPDFWWEDTCALEYEGQELRMLSTERYLLYTTFRLYTHVFRHLRFFVLPAEIISKYQNEIDWRKFLAFSGRYRMKRLVLFTLKILHDLLDVKIPVEIEKGRVCGYKSLKRFVISRMFDESEKSYARILVYAALQDTPLDTLKIVAGRLFPDMSEIRVRYRVSEGSSKAYLYYLLNPFLLPFKKRSDVR
jgi:hypothetical protein